MNNAYFGYDCCNNLNNFKFVPTFAELNEMSYIKKDYNIYDKDVSKFLSSELLEREIDKKFNDKMMKIQKNDPFWDIKLTALNYKRKEDDLQAIEAFKEKQKR